MVEPGVRPNVPGRVPYDWKPADRLKDPEELEYWEMALCVFDDALLDEKAPYDWKPAEGLNGPEELEYWALAVCVFDDALLDETMDSPVFDSWELDHVLLIDDGPDELDDGTNELANWLAEELAVVKVPDHDVLCELVPESIVLERLDESWVEVEASVLEDPPDPSNATLGSAPSQHNEPVVVIAGFHSRELFLGCDREGGEHSPVKD